MDLSIRKIRGFVKAAVRSMAFLPLPMLFAGILLGAGIYYLESHTDASAFLESNLPSFVVKSQDTARNVLGLFVAGLMTLMVFTFTQMMSLFNQVANAYSPRLLPIFTGDRSLQFTMGFYIGTIVLNLMVLLSIKSDEAGEVPNLSVLTAILFGIISLMLFIYFVTTISEKIQVGNIINTVYQRGMNYLKEESSRDAFTERDFAPDTDRWYTVTSPIDGYLGIVDHPELSKLAKQFNTRFYIGSIKGDFIPASFPLLSSERELDAKEVEKVLRAISPISNEYADWYQPQIDLLIDIAQKAMSPGINDPATAVRAIDRINGLLGHLMHIPNYNFMQDDDGGEVWLARHTFSDVLADTFSRLRNYSREDAAVTHSLLKSAYSLYAASGGTRYLQKLLDNEALALVNDARMYLKNPRDRKALASQIVKWRRSSRQWLERPNKLQDSASKKERGIAL
ncbi:DUF2254 domain-containing protein [Lewinella sp. 4G2]|uniref:DUF2254 domain-containing protein n=1 Tax=Lewinella sp. 4G2 TaxID=1803372 RepID=UPI0007B4A77B|nr:DUF2254 domain-containing protein [Lewinella sp. 4G2]OAV45496.1 hypothetical protein A3850_013800 [Lewinella sp. 4G2]